MIRALVLLIAFAAAFSTVPAPACGPFIAVAIFEPGDHPPAPEERQKEDLGIVLGSYRVPDLVQAWRVLTGKPELPSPVASSSQPYSMPAEQWLEARAEVIKDGKAPVISTERPVPGQDFEFYPNCLYAAFANAAATLRDRVKRFGPNHDGVRNWIKAQDAVFSNCGRGSARVDPPEPGLQQLLAADRRYQIASGAFYAGQFDTARNLWLEIADEPDSPWRRWASYLAARCLIRKAALGSTEERQTQLERAEAELKRLASEDSDAEIRRAAEALAGFVASKLRPVEQMAGCARRLESSDGSASDLQELVHLWKVLDNSTFKPGTGSALLDWLFAMRGNMPFEELMQRWRREQSQDWLVAALQRDAPPADLLQAAMRVKADAPAFATAAWARVRAVHSDPDARRSLLDQLLPELRQNAPRASLNWFLRQRLAVARDFGEYVQFAPRRLAAEGFAGAEESSFAPQSRWPEVLLDEDGATLLDRFLPLTRWTALIESGAWSSHLRTRILRAGFVRAMTSGNGTATLMYSRQLRAAVPEIQALLRAYEQAQGDDARRFAAAWAVLKLPGLQPEFRSGFDREERIGQLSNLRDNWWCAPPAERERPVMRPSWITEAEARQADRERQAGGGTLPFVTPIVVAWAEQHHSDPRSPEALALSVRASRYGCRDAATGKFSRQAFEVLHRKFPGSSWAQQTPYWYGAPL